MRTALAFVRSAVTEAATLSMTLFKVMVPIIVAVKICQELDLIRYLALPLAPLMKLTGLPPEMGLAWATAMVNNIYAGIIVFASLVPDAPVTAAQATVLATMMLVAHGLPVEMKIAQLSGPRMWFQGVLRVGGALVLGASLNLIYSSFDMLTEPASLAWAPEQKTSETWLSWALDEVFNLLMIFVIILGLILLLRLLRALRVTDLMDRLLGPVLKLMGIGRTASTITIVGLTLGLSYGGGLIINEARSGRVSSRDIFYSISLMGLCHSLIEDTLLMMVIGGRLSGIFWGRLVFSLLAVALLVRLTRRMSDYAFARFFCKNAAAQPGADPS